MGKKLLIGIVTFGNMLFTKLTIESFRREVKTDFDLFVVVGKPGDIDTINYLSGERIPHVVHTENMGFPYSLNDIYDYAWVHNGYDYLIIAGNDIVVYPDAVDKLVKVADSSDYECISALQYDVKSLVGDYPDTRKYFQGTNYIFDDFNSKPWEAFSEPGGEPEIADMQMYDIQNLCLYKRSLFNKIGYTDVNFYPAYYVDNDYARRIVKANIRCCTVTNARFFHFWSRTIHQGNGGSNDRYFKNNQRYYRQKWGGDFGKETTDPNLCISDRLLEKQMIDHWKSQ